MEEIVIGMDAKRIVSNSTGLGSYGRTLVNDLAAIEDFNIRLYAPDAGRVELRQQIAKGDRVHFCYPHGWQPLGKSYWRTRGMTRQLRRDGVQVYHGLSGELPMGLAKAGIRSVVTIHDLIFMRHPEWYNSADVKIYTRKLRHAVKQADAIVAISECTRQDICELCDVDPERITVVYQSCAPRFALDAAPDEQTLNHVWYVNDLYNLPDRYILSVGSIEERKNILLALKALQLLPDDVSLVVVGRATKYSDMVWRYACENGIEERVVLLHNVPDKHLPPIYRRAEAFVYPSRYEGFGIPIIEAISMGLPVVACTGSCLEEAGGPHNLYVDPDDERALANAIAQVMWGADGREQRIEKSKEYIRKFENSDAARRMADIYRSLAGR